MGTGSTALQAERSSYYYKGRKTDPVALKRRIKAIAETRVRYGYPWTIRVDNGPEFVSRGRDLWAYQRDVTHDFSRPG